MANRDIKLVENEPLVKNGDFVIDFSDEQHIQDTINAFPGWWKQYPDEGVGIRSWIGSPANIQQIAKTIRLNLEADGYKVNNPEITISPNGDLIINPNVTI